jgi:hypothetical protein
MAPVLVATLAGANSNSYITVADATTYFDNRLDAADWTAATADNKAASLITATGWLDTLEFYGDRSATTQALKWPRINVTCDGIKADATFIPREILDATCETALALLRNPTMLRARRYCPRRLPRGGTGRAARQVPRPRRSGIHADHH